jgi:protease I
MTAITDARFLIIATDGFEQSELMEPRDQLIAAGAQVVLASPEPHAIQGMKHDEKAATITPDITLDQVDEEAFDALIIPGGVANPDTLRMNEQAIDIVRAFNSAGKPVAAICHGPWLLIEADIVEDRRVTGWPSVRTDLVNAGGYVFDQEVVVDGNLITSRKPGDIPAFVTAIRAAVAEAAPAHAA